MCLNEPTKLNGGSMIDVDGKLCFQGNIARYFEEGTGIALGPLGDLEVLCGLQSEVVVLVGRVRQSLHNLLLVLWIQLKRACHLISI